MLPAVVITVIVVIMIMVIVRMRMVVGTGHGLACFVVVRLIETTSAGTTSTDEKLFVNRWLDMHGLIAAGI
ncbi:hypothetical protein [Bradyrhizobium sp. 2TAF24]|uniref:hypothetical protein n=1 Tax=Bradyrhizobium sp. 2TAF24 TaxID=3233011 RepID=UPI003F90D358